MKIAIAGATGFIGGGALQQALQHPSITSVIALSRRELPSSSSHPKLEVVIMKDFESYGDDLLEKLKDVEACLWCIGSYGNRKVVVDYPIAFCNAVLPILRNRTSRKPFRFILLSGCWAVQDQNAPLWVLPIARKTNGLAEIKTLAFAAENSSSSVPFETVWPIQTDELGAAMVHIVLNGAEGEAPEGGVVMNDWMLKKGEQLLEKNS